MAQVTDEVVSGARLGDLIAWYDDCCDPPMHTIEQSCTTCDTLRALRELQQARAKLAGVEAGTP